MANTVTVETVAPGTATTTVNGALQSLAGGTLVVASTTGFASSGTFQVAGITGVCAYTSTDGTHFFGITGCTGTPNDTATVTAGSSTFTAHATSGAGGSSVGVAGSIAVNVVTSNTTSNAGTTNPVTVNGDVSLTARTNHTNNAIADAKQASNGSTSGVGASFALNVVNETTSASLANGATLTGAKSLTLTANDTDATTTTADGGASAGSGSIALSAQVAISLSNVTTSATIGTGSDLSVAGAVTAHATQTAKVTTTATGATKGGNAGIGLSLALTVANHLVDSQLERNLSATGAVSFTADGSSSTDSEATASSKGAKGKGDDSSGKDVNGKADSNLSDANSTSSGASGKDSGKTNTPAAKSGDDSSGSGGTSVEVAAAAAITMITSQSLAQIADGLTVTSGGLVTLSTSANTDGTAKGSGSAVDASSLNIGAAVGIVLATVTNAAVVGADATVNSHGLTLAAAMRNNAGDTKHSFDAEATSGAGKGKVGIAGSFALTIANVTTNAEIKSNGARAPPNMNSSDVTLSAASSVSSTDKAMANDKDAGTVGIGAGAALNIVFDTTTASIDDGAALTGAKNVTLSATDTDATTTYAEAGATGGSGSDLVLTADAAIALPTVLTSATIAGDASQTLTTSGAVSVSATQTATATTTAKGDATGGDVAIGLALALAIPDDEVTASDSRTISATKVSFAANGSSDTETEADASAAGAQGQDSGTKKDSSGKDVNGKADDQVSNANSESSANTGKTSKTSDTSGAKAQTSDSNGTSSGDSNTVTVAGAVAINIVTTISKASLADTANVTATAGAVSLKTQANTDATAKANGKADEAGTVGIGAGVSVNSVHITNVATTGNATVSSNGLDVEAGMRVLGTDHIQRFDGSEWKTIESGAAFPEDPEDGDFFQLTQGVPGTTAVDGASQSLVATGSNLKVKSTLQFGAPGATGTFTIAGITGTCSYQVTDGTNFQVTVCAGTPEDKATVTMNTSTKVVGAQSLPAATTLDGDQDLTGGTLKVVSLVGFDPSGQFTIAGISGTCSYTGTSGGNTFTGVTGCTGKPLNGTAVTRVGGTSSLTVLSTTGFDPSSGFFTGSGITGTCTYTGTSGGNTFTGITGCSGSLKDNASITRVAFAPGIYKWDDTLKLWVFQTVGIPTGTGFPTTPATGDYFQLTKAPSTTVKGAGQDLSSTTTLNVASTFGFLQTNGTFTGAGITSTCNYTGTTPTSFTGVSGCTGTPADGAAITAGTAAGIYKWNGSAWTFLGDGTALPETPAPATGDLFRLAEHDVAAEAESGAGGDKDTLSLAGSVAINIVSNHTEAIVPAGATVSAGTGDVTLKTLSNEEDTAKADSDAKSGKVGIGASVSVQVLNDYIVRSAIEDGATFSGGAALTISADSHHTVETEDKAGSEGGTLALSPSVSIAIVTDDVSAHLGTGAALTVTGAASITATEDLDSSLDSNASAGGDNVAIGAAVAINVIETNTTADLARDLNAASLTIGATTTQMTDAKSESSSKGEQDGDKSSDKQSNDQVQNNPNTKDKTGGDNSLPQASDSTSQGSSESSSQSGDSDSGGVNIAAAVSINWARTTNVASIAPNLTVVATGAVKISAEDQTGANSRAIGFSGNLQSDVAIGAGVGLNVEDITNTASIGAGANVTGGGVTVEAVTPSGKEDDFIVWGIAAAGGKSDASIAASVGIQVLTFHTTASIGAGAHVTSTDVVDVEASQKIGLQNLAIAAALSTSGTAVGGAFVVNILPAVQTQAFIDAGAVVDAAGALTVKATSSINPIVPDPKITKITLPAVSSIAVAGGAGGGDAAVTGSVIVDVFSITTQAWIADNAQINQSGPLGTSAQTIDVEATDTTHLINVAGALALSEGSAAVGVSIIVDVIDKDVGAWIGKTAHVSSGGDMSVSASSTENLFELAVAGGASEGAAVTGSILVVVLNEAGTHSTTAFIDDGAVVHAGGKVAVSASDSADLTLSSGNVAVGGGSAGVGASVVVLVRNGTVDAAVHQNAHVDADGGNGLSVSATQSVNGIYIAVGGAGGDSVGVAGSVVVDVMSDSTKAHVDGGVVIGDAPSAGLHVSATDTTSIISIAGAIAIGGTAGVGAGVDVEVVSKDTEAWLAGTVNATLSGDATVDATSSESLTSIAVGGGFAGTAAVNVNVGVPVFNVTTDAYIAGGATVSADGSVRVSATESLGMNVIGGNISAAGTAAVGAAAAIPIVTKETHAFIGDGAHVTAGLSGPGLTVGTGAFTITQVDPRFDPSAPGLLTGGSVFTLDPNLVASFREDERVIYDNGGSPSIGGLSSVEDNPNSVYYVHIVSPTAIQLLSAPGGFTADSGAKSCSGVVVCGLTAPSAANRGESHRFVPTDQGGVREDTSPRFDPQNGIDVNTGTDFITLPYNIGIGTDDQVLYSSGDGQAIGGLQSGQTYYAINVTSTTNSTHLQLSATKGGSAIDLTSTGTGKSHSIVRGGDTPSGDASETGPRVIAPTTTSLNGVAVTASNSDDIAAVGIAAGFSGEAAVNLSGAVAVVTANTSAYIGKSAEIDSAGDVKVTAGNQYHELSVAASIAVSGGAGVGVGVGIRLLTLNTDAFIDNSAVVSAGGNVSVIATGKESIIAVVAGVGGGEVGVAGTVDVTILHVHTFASTGTNVSILAGNNVLVSAQDDSKLILITASLAGGYVGIGVAVGVASVTKDTEAFIGAGSNVDAQAGGAAIPGVYDGNFTGSGGFETSSYHGLAVQSASSEDVFGLAASIGGGFVGVAGGVGVTLLHVTTQAFVGNGAIADSDGGSVNVAAVDSFTSFTVAGGAGGGFVGVAGGVDIGVADSSVTAYLGAGTSVNAAGDVGVFGLSTKNVRTYALSIGAGFVGAAGSVSVWTIGTQPVTTYNDAAGGPDRGTWSSTVANDPNNFYKKGDVVTFNGSKYAAKTDHPLNDPSDTSEWEGNTDAMPNNGSTAQGSADQAASGDDESGGPGYKSILNGASAPSSGPAPAWISGHAYSKDDKVTFGGQTYTARQDVTSAVDPAHDQTNWQLNSASDAKTNDRVASALSSPKSTITSAAPTGNVASDALASVVPAGTSASIQGNVVAGRGVHVRAKDNLTVNGIAGSIAVGFVGVGAAILIMNVDSSTEASIAAGSSITAGAGGSGDVTSRRR